MIKVDKNENYSIKIFNHNLYTFYNHWIYKITQQGLSNLKININGEQYRAILMDKNTIPCCQNSEFSIEYMQKLKETYPQQFVGIILFNLDNEICGYICGLYPDSKEIQYKIKYVDFFVKYVYVYPEFRGKNLVSVLFKELFRAIRPDQLCLAVRKNNLPAIKAYEKIGGVRLREKKFVRILKFNFPYHKL